MNELKVDQEAAQMGFLYRSRWFTEISIIYLFSCRLCLSATVYWSIYSAHKWGQLARIYMYIYGIGILLEAEVKKKLDMGFTVRAEVLQSLNNVEWLLGRLLDLHYRVDSRCLNTPS
jgi:hypothetical protein